MPVQYNNIKSCTRCKTIYSGDISLYFYKKKGTADKYAPQCKTCIKEGILK
jgi:hypothetical protein